MPAAAAIVPQLSPVYSEAATACRLASSLDTPFSRSPLYTASWMEPLTSPAPCKAPIKYLAATPIAAAIPTGAPSATPAAAAPMPSKTVGMVEPIPCAVLWIGASVTPPIPVPSSFSTEPDLAASFSIAARRCCSACRSGDINVPSLCWRLPSPSAGALSAPNACATDLAAPKIPCPVDTAVSCKENPASFGAAAGFARGDCVC